MKNLRLAALVAVMTALPVVSFAQTTTPTSKTTKAPKPVTSTVTGVVKSVDASSLSVSRSNPKGPDVTFQLNASTTGQAGLKVGDAVTVRYVDANGQKTATVVKKAPVKKAPKAGGK